MGAWEHTPSAEHASSVHASASSHSAEFRQSTSTHLLMSSSQISFEAQSASVWHGVVTTGHPQTKMAETPNSNSEPFFIIDHSPIFERSANRPAPDSTETLSTGNNRDGNGVRHYGSSISSPALNLVPQSTSSPVAFMQFTSSGQ